MFGLGFFAVLLEWSRYFGAVAIVPLVVGEAAFLAGAGAIVAGLDRRGLRSPWLTAVVWVVVEGLQMIKKHMRKSQQHPNGAIINRELPIHISNLSLLDPMTNKATRMRTAVNADGSKQRVSAKNKAVIS